MQEAQNRQSLMLQEMLKQRDMYKNMYYELINRSSTSEHVEFSDFETFEACKEITKENNESSMKMNKKENDFWKNKFDDTEKKYSNLLNDFDLYKNERISHEKMLNDEIERLRQDCEKYSVKCCRLRAQLDSVNERFGLLQTTLSSYKSQIRVLEDKCNNYTVTIGK